MISRAVFSRFGIEPFRFLAARGRQGRVCVTSTSSPKCSGHTMQVAASPVSSAVIRCEMGQGLGSTRIPASTGPNAVIWHRIIYSGFI